MDKLKKKMPLIFLVLAVSILFIAVFIIYLQPYRDADKRNRIEEDLIEDYLDRGKDDPEPQPREDNDTVEYMYSDIVDYSFHGYIDSVLVIDKINLKKAVIRGNSMDDNDFNLSLYYFVTADLSTDLEGNYIIYGHSSQVYGHSFNRLDELQKGDNFYLIQNGVRYDYQVEAVDRALRSESRPYFPDLEQRVTLVSCEKHLEKGYSEKRIIIVRAVQINKS